MTSPEAPLLQRMNMIKEHADESLLTDAQEQARQAIRDHRDDNAQFVNLHGPRYAGKTFLCWILQQNESWVYYQAISNTVDTPTVIYDHGESDRRSTRQLRNQASIYGLATVIYVTQKPATELYPRVELRPKERHYEKVAATWEELGLDLTTAPAPIQQ